MRLTEKTIRQLEPPASGNRVTYDDEISGFGIRVTASGARAFVLNYFIEGRERRMTIGAFPAWSATGAREHAKKLRVKVDRGEDPLEKKQARRGALTFGALATEYRERHAIHKRDGGDVDRARLDRDVLPLWRNRKAEDITRADVIRLVETKAQSAPIAANRLLALVRKVFNFAVSRDLLQANPCLQVKAPGQEAARDRVLNESEIRALWTALESGLLDKGDGKEPAALAMSTEVRSILRLILATGQRPGECCAIEWAELDDSGEWWTVPAAKAKNGRAHRVPLTKLAREILTAQPREGRYVFPSPRREKAIEVNALTHALRNNEHLGLEHFTAHDLRRSVSDWLARMGIDGRARSAVLNHKESGTTERHYTVYSYDPEKKQALEKWARKLRAIITGRAASVVSIA